MKKRTKRYDDGGLTFAEMDDADREAMAKARMAEMGGPMPEEPKRVTKQKRVNAGDTRENLRDLDMQGADTGYDATERVRNAKKTQTRHTSGRPSASAEPQVFEPRKKGAVEDLVDIFKRGGKYLMNKGGKISSASKRADGCAIRGKTRGKIV